MLVRHAVWKLYDPKRFAKFSDPSTLGIRAYASRDYYKEVQILRKESSNAMMELAEALDRSSKDRESQKRFIRIVGGSVCTYGIQPYEPKTESPDETVKCELTGKRIPASEALVVHLMRNSESPTQRKRGNSMYRQALQVLDEEGADAFTEFVNANIQDMFHWFTPLVFSHRRLRFVDALLKVRCPELEIDAFAVELVESHNGDIEAATEALSSYELQIDNLIASLHKAFDVISTSAQKVTE